MEQWFSLAQPFWKQAAAEVGWLRQWNKWQADCISGVPSVVLAGAGC